MAKQQHLPAQGDLRARLVDTTHAFGASVTHLLQRFHLGNKQSNLVVIQPHESEVVAGEIVWEDWIVDPAAIEESANGALRIRGYEDRALWRGPFTPLTRQEVEAALQQGQRLSFRAHPTATGLFLVETAA